VARGQNSKGAKFTLGGGEYGDVTPRRNGTVRKFSSHNAAAFSNSMRRKIISGFRGDHWGEKGGRNDRNVKKVRACLSTNEKMYPSPLSPVWVCEK